MLAFVLGLRWLAPEPEARAVWLYLVALPIGYGHLVGGLWFARERILERLPKDLPRGLVLAFWAVATANLLAAYTWALHFPALHPWVLVPMLLISAWHIVENDLALGHAYASRLRLGGLEMGARSLAAVLGATGLIGFAALATPTGALFGGAWLGSEIRAIAPFSIDELATAVLLYHAVSWLGFFWERSRQLARRDRAAALRLKQKLVLLHAGPLAGNALLYFFAPSVYLYVAAPTLYLFWSVLHAVQTGWVRKRPAEASVRVPA